MANSMITTYFLLLAFLLLSPCCYAQLDDDSSESPPPSPTDTNAIEDPEEARLIYAVVSHQPPPPPPVRQSTSPPVRQSPPPVRQSPPPVRQSPPPVRHSPPPAHQSPPPSPPAKIFNVLNYGAVANEYIDNSKAFLAAFHAACQAGNSVILVPWAAKRYLISPTNFQSQGCKPNVVMQVEGNLLSITRDTWLNHYPLSKVWLEFTALSNFTVLGGRSGGIFDGQGGAWWATSCKTDKTQRCTDAPTAMRFSGGANIKVDGITVSNSQQIHLTFSKCNGVQAKNIRINSPETSPNTDGIHVSATSNIVIHDSDISAGDDCVSIVTGSSNIQVYNIRCGPGHGISIGSLGKGGEYAQVENVEVTNCTCQGTENGARIKTWQGGSGYVKHVRFTNMTMVNVKNAVTIDQFYCNGGHHCPAQGPSAVEIDDVRWDNIFGTCTNPAGVNLNCAKGACHALDLSGHVYITLAKNSTREAAWQCLNIEGLDANCNAA